MAPRSPAGALNKIFPNHWSFLLGEWSLYSFVVLIVTGVYLTFFFDASTEPDDLRGQLRAAAGRRDVARPTTRRSTSASTCGPACVMRQIHHWAALLFLAAIVVHLGPGVLHRRLPRAARDQLGHRRHAAALAIVNGFAGYSLLDDQLSGTGLRIAYSVPCPIPLVGHVARVAALRRRVPRATTSSRGCSSSTS